MAKTKRIKAQVGCICWIVVKEDSRGDQELIEVDEVIDVEEFEEIK